MGTPVFSHESPDDLNRSRSHGWLRYSVLAIVAFVAAGATLRATRTWGVGISADSTVYIAAARSLQFSGSLQSVDDLGHTIPLVHSAPLYPVILAVFSALFGMDPLASARWVSAGFFGLNIALLGAIAWRVFLSWPFALVAVTMALVSTPMVDMHLLALSEPPYLFLELLALFLLASHLKHPRPALLAGAGVATALAILTRYAGAALVGTEIIALLFLSKRRPRWVVMDSVIFSLLCGLPFATWLLRNRLVSGKATTAQVSGNHIANPQILWGGLGTLSSWLLPGSVPTALRLAICGVLLFGFVGAFWIATRNMKVKGGEARLDAADPLLMGLFCVSHVAFTIAVLSFLYADIPLDDRNFLPILCPAILVFLWMVKRVAGEAANRKSFLLLPGFALITLFCVTNAPRSAKLASKAAKSGLGYSSRDWQTSQVIRLLRTAGPGIPVYSTLPSAVRFLTTSPARALPRVWDNRNAIGNVNYAQEINQMHLALRGHPVAVVYFGGNPRSWYASEPDMRREFGLVFVDKDAVGSLDWSPELTATK